MKRRISALITSNSDVVGEDNPVVIGDVSNSEGPAIPLILGDVGLDVRTIPIEFATEALEVAAQGDVSASPVGASTKLGDPNLQEFPPLQASNQLREKRKVKGKGVKTFVGSKNKFDMLSGLGNEVSLEMVRKPRAASQGVVNLLQELKLKKRDAVGRVQSQNVVIAVGDNLVVSS
ncbi:hypothetical protein V6N11_076629 [Hibiscus sabdariffa]|uniref:Uncharacterized protein n=1 Tax=Hibiscus sabdariffa TaxID=183260 RepID=A0ABR2Q6U2_9ROSI